MKGYRYLDEIHVKIVYSIILKLKLLVLCIFLLKITNIISYETNIKYKIIDMWKIVKANENKDWSVLTMTHFTDCPL